MLNSKEQNCHGASPIQLGSLKIEACLVFGVWCLVFLFTPSLRAQLVADGATNTLSNVSTNITGNVTVGTNGSFTLLILSDNALLTNSLRGMIGQNATAKTNEVRLLSPTARWQMGDALYLGSNGSFNRLVVSNGATVRDLVGFVAVNASSSNNTVLVTGSGSTWSNLSDVWVGANGAGNQLVVSNGGTVLASGSGLVGANGSNNVAVVTGSGSLWSNAFDLQVGNFSAANRLVVSEGGGLRNGHGYVGVNPPASNNLALITGAGSLWSNALDLEVGAFSANNQMIVSNGAAVFAGANGLLGSDTNAKGNSVMASDPGTSWFVGANLYVGSNGVSSRLVVSNGASVENNGAALGFNASSSSNSASVIGSGSIWTNRGDLTVGYSGRDNQLVVSNGGFVASRFGYVSLQRGSSNNLVVVSGSGSVWTNQFDLEFGYKDHSNRMVIEAGGLVTCDNGRIASGGDLVFGTVPINNQVLVTGPGSLWTNRSAVEVNNALVGGYSLLVVSNGAAVTSGGAGNVGGTGNKVVITGAGSRWANQSDFTLGGSANQLEVSDGASMTASNVTSGSFFSGGDDTLLVTGPGTIWTNRGDLTMGLSSGVRSVLVTSNGAVGSSRVDLQACKLEYSIVSPK